MNEVKPLESEPVTPVMQFTQEQLAALIAAEVAKATAKPSKAAPKPPEFGLILDKYGNTQFGFTHENGFKIFLGTPLKVSQVLYNRTFIVQKLQELTGLNVETTEPEAFKAALSAHKLLGGKKVK
jgi:hypothetical protein